MSSYLWLTSANVVVAEEAHGSILHYEEILMYKSDVVSCLFGTSPFPSPLARYISLPIPISCYQAQFPTFRFVLAFHCELSRPPLFSISFPSASFRLSRSWCIPFSLRLIPHSYSVSTSLSFRSSTVLPFSSRPLPFPCVSRSSLSRSSFLSHGTILSFSCDDCPLFRHTFIHPSSPSTRFHPSRATGIVFLSALLLPLATLSPASPPPHTPHPLGSLVFPIDDSERRGMDG